MTCSSAGTIDSPPSSPKRLVPVYLMSRKRSKISASISFLRIAFLPLAVNDTTRGSSMRSWIQARCSGSEMCMYSTPIWPAIGALQDAEHLAKRAELEPERAAEIDRAVVVGFGEAVGLRLELGMLAASDELERVELGGEVAAGAVGADQHAQRRACPRRGKSLAARSSACSAADTRALPLRAPRTARAPRRKCRPGLSSRLAKKARHSGSTENGSSSDSARKARRDRWRLRLAGTTCWKTRRSVHVSSFDQPCRSLGAPACRAKEASIGRPPFALM